MAEFTQKQRQVAVESPLGKDVLLLEKLSGTEQLGRPFSYELELVSEQLKIDANKLLGEAMTVRLQLAKNKYRYFHGLVSRFTKASTDGAVTRYRATLVPWLWMLTRTADCRIFQEMKIPDIVKEVFRDHSSDFEDRLSREYRTCQYIAQYRETDFNFVSRLMEREGIYYFFEQDNGKHTLILTDATATHEPFGDYETIKYYPPSQTAVRDEEHVSDWSVDYQVLPGKVVLNDFDFKNPKDGNSRLVTMANVDREHAMAQGEVFDYPGGYEAFADGQEYAKSRIQELQCDFEVARGQADARGICCGYTFDLSKHPDDDQNRRYLITGAAYQLKSDTSDQASGTAHEGSFNCTFTAINAQERFVPARTTRKPVVQGPQTATVVGSAGDNITVDEYGRVKVQFHWDRYGKSDQNSSCWVRVSQNWAGKNWGGMFIPHIGQEVLVECLEGDPDHPMITGRVYNADNKVPLELPANKTKSIIRDHGGNQIIMEGKDKEQFIHIQQQCGNEILLNGKEGAENVQLRDKFGNEIVLDAVDKTIKMIAPNEESKLVLGKSIFRASQSDDATFVAGNVFGLYLGCKNDIYGGFRSQTDVGFYAETMLGSKMTLTIGSEVNYRYGFVYNRYNAREVTVNDCDFVQHAKDDIKIDSDTSISLVGGPGDRAQIRAGDGIILEYQESAVAARGKLLPFSKSTVGSVALGTTAVGLLAGTVLGISMASTSGSDVEPTNAEAWIGGSLGMIAAVGGVAGGYLVSKSALSADNNSTVEPNTSPDAKITMDKDKLLSEAGTSKIEIKKDAEIIVRSKGGDVEIESDKGNVKIMTGKYLMHGKHKWNEDGSYDSTNFKVLR